MYSRVLVESYVYMYVHATTFSLDQSSFDDDWIETHLQLTALIRLHCELLPTGSLFSAH